jgi:transposase
VRGRSLAAWLGLVPRQKTTGGRPKLLGITKRGSRYLRKLLIQARDRPCRRCPGPPLPWAAGYEVSSPATMATQS